MRTLTSRRSPAPIALAATLLAAFVFLFAWPQSAAAHDTLIDSDPAAGATVDTMPSQLTLTFSAAPIDGDGATEVVVLGPSEESVTDGAPTLDGAMLTQPLKTEAAAGEYRVVWRIVSSDGHATSEEFRFTVATSTLAPSTTEPSAAATTSPTAEETAAPAPEESAAGTATEAPDADPEASFSPIWIIVGAVVVVIAAIVLVVVLRRRKKTDPESDAPAER